MHEFRFEPVELPPSAKELRHKVRALIASEVARGAFNPRQHTWSSFDADFSRKCGEHSFIGMIWPKKYGGHERTALERYVVTEEMLAGGAPVGGHWIADRQSGHQILKNGSERARAEILPKIAAGTCFFSIGMSEPDSGSDLAAVRTKAAKTEGGWKISGSKVWTSNAHRAHYLISLARTAPKEAGPAGISAFLVDAGIPGLTVAPHYKKMGFRGSHTADVIFENCRVPASALLGGKEGVGFKTAMKSLDHARLHMAAVAVGLATRLIDEGVRYASERRQFGKPIADFQMIQAMLAESEAEAFAARAMVEKASRDKDAGLRIVKESACCKFFATEAMWRIADRVMQIHGGSGDIKEDPIERLFRDARLLRIYEGTSQIQQIIIAREMMREAA